ncbi:MAG: hypothetical protein H2058_08755 [Muricauda sp.]|nr:hypothetical protein [Allomuricauda sp.]MBA4745335.1 hypothetical protein [Allomuricauda sp.]
MIEGKKILFRVDAGEQIGLGHFFRSYHLGKALRNRGFYVSFVHADSLFWSQLPSFEFEHYNLESGSEEDQTVEICISGNFDLLYVDAICSFREEKLNKVKPKAKVVFYQNLTESRFLADIFILPSIHQKDSFFEGFVSSGTKVYQGLEYSILNERMNEFKQLSKNYSLKVNEIGIISGGSDPRNVLGSVYNLLDFNRWQEIMFVFYFGENYLHRGSVPTYLPSNVSFKEFDFDTVIESDVVIATFGVSTYELLSIGMPVMSIGHQKSNTEASDFLANKTGALYHLGLIDNINKDQINQAISQFLDVEIREKLGNRAKEIVDNKGVNRVIKIIEEIL